MDPMLRLFLELQEQRVKAALLKDVQIIGVLPVPTPAERVLLGDPRQAWREWYRCACGRRRMPRQERCHKCKREGRNMRRVRSAA